MKTTRVLAAALVLAAAGTLPLQAQGRITVGQTVRGTLTSSSPTLEDGSHYDAWTLAGRAGQSVTITLRSDDFDAYLSVGRMSGGEFESMETDDDGGGGTDSRVQLTLPSSGEFVIRANTLSEGETGAYTLEVASGGQPAPEPPAGDMDMVGMLLDSAVVVMGAAGVSPQGPPVLGSLADSESSEVTVQVPASELVAIVGVCDESCSDLDLTVYGPDGAILGSDVLPDDAPIVRLENARAGTYRVRVTMANCDASSCNFGVRVFGN